MLDIFNKLGPFFLNNYQELGIREYARATKISPPTAATTLKQLEIEGLVDVRKFKNYILYTAKRESRLFIMLQNAFYEEKLKHITKYLVKYTVGATIILFGSATKGNISNTSDLDIYVHTKDIGNLPKKFQEVLNKPIQIHTIQASRNTHLLENIKRGIWLHGNELE
jgi:predicted nucleotidyltransferase